MREEEAARALGKKLTDSESARPNRNVKKIEFNPFEENIRKMREEEEAGRASMKKTLLMSTDPNLTKVQSTE